MYKHALVWSLMGLLLVPTTLVAEEGSKDAKPADVTVRKQNHMSTYVTITVAAPESEELVDAINSAFTEIGRLSIMLSEWRGESQISEVNRMAGKKPVEVSLQLFRLAKLAQGVSVASDGAFDITFQALLGLWNFKNPMPKLPDADEVAKRALLVDYSQVVLDEEKHTIFLKKKGMAIGLGGIAKGYVVDRASKILKNRGFENHLIIAGGDLYASGTHGDRKWRVGIRHPKDRQIYATLEIQNEGVATSGNYEKFFELDGKRYHHLLDPNTGRPAMGTASVTVVAPSAALADAYATALFVQGAEKGKKLAEREGLEVLYFTEKDFALVHTDGIAKRMQVVKK